jgi:hypothetical protein
MWSAFSQFVVSIAERPATEKAPGRLRASVFPLDESLTF